MLSFVVQAGNPDGLILLFEIIKHTIKKVRGGKACKMFSKVIPVVVLFASLGCAFADYTPSTDDFILNTLIPYLNVTNFLLDGPASVSYALTTPTTNGKPTLEQMMYSNYYSASMYCQYQLSDLSCEYCAKFKGDVAKRKGKIKKNQ